MKAVYLGFDVNVQTGEIAAPCGCSACDDGVQSGHFACSTSPDELIEDEQEEGGCHRSYVDGGWRWFAPEGSY